MLDAPEVSEGLVFLRLCASAGVNVKLFNKTPLGRRETKVGHGVCVERDIFKVDTHGTRCQALRLSQLLVLLIRIRNPIDSLASVMALTQAELLKNESIDDRVNSLLVAGTGINLTYDDNANTLTIAGAGNLDYGLITGSVTGTSDYGSLT